MKKIAITIIAIVAQISLGFSQNAKTVVVNHQDIDHKAVEVSFMENPKEVKSDWDKYLRKNYDVNLKGNGFLANKEVLKAEEVIIPGISPKRMDFYTQVIEGNEKGTSVLRVFADYGYSISLDPNTFPAEYNRMKMLVENFATTYQEELYNEQKEIVADLKEEQKDLESEIESLEEELEEKTEEVESAEGELKAINGMRN